VAFTELFCKRNDNIEIVPFGNKSVTKAYVCMYAFFLIITCTVIKVTMSEVDNEYLASYNNQCWYSWNLSRWCETIIWIWLL